MNVADALKRVLVGRKLASAQLGETLLPKRIALPVFASDALSSVAYAPDEIILTLSLAGVAGFFFSWQIGLAVAVVMAVVVLSYRQTVHAYPSGGGDFEVATVNLGPNAGLTVASALLVDYILTVAVSVSSGVQNAKALFPFMVGYEGVVAAVIILVLMAMNLRGVRESGTLFAIPTYGFMFAVLGMILVGLFRIFVLGQPLNAPTAEFDVVGDPFYSQLTGFAMIALLARAFSSGSAALTGVEAISNGVPAFREPKSRNAATTLALLGTIAISMLTGILALANLTRAKMVDEAAGVHFTLNGAPVEDHQDTIIAQLAATVFDVFPVGFVLVITMTMIILFLAANTAFNGFPVLSSILARHGFLPKALYTRGDRLAYSNGIILLALAAVGLVLVFNASVTALIQLYVVGVFVSFTVSQLGMLRHWTRHLATEVDPAARRTMKRARAINAVGLTFTGTVLVIVLASKFIYGAYLAILAMALLFVLMKLISRHYQKVAEETALSPSDVRMLPSRVHAVVLVTELDKPSLRAVTFARASRSSSMEAVTVASDEEHTRHIREQWDALDPGMPLKIISSPYREVVTPFVKYVKGLSSGNPRDVVMVYVPELVVGHWWERLLHNQTTLLIKTRLAFVRGVITAAVPYQLASSRHAIDRVVRQDGAKWRRPGTGTVHSGAHLDDE
ncbi:APC family permease [Propioniciclava coleopterorum]|uniref:APC family permease n=1 Tax=Propioniciclava coleopterorum TaxID=2714937 RepID=A0A6G7Y963_9ACTN|nr:APC family permease [Propioniciclava coleopterorum]QIK73434.1 APC family permease [Propioniciclava coleopterorum]